MIVIVKFKCNLNTIFLIAGSSISKRLICTHLKLAIPIYFFRFKLLARLFYSKQKLPSKENFCLEASVVAIATC
jgi:hypothetical protein